MTNWWADKTPPRFHSFSPVTGEYIGDGDCDPSPLEPGVWLVPGHATLTTPPTLGEKLTAVWNGDKWVATVDRRGEIRWLDKQFVAIKDLGDPISWGLPDMVVHDAEYYIPEGSTDPSGAMIYMWINDDEIGFHDNPELLARRVLAAWEAKGGVIRPIAEPVIDPLDDLVAPFAPNDDAARRLDDLAADLDRLAQSGVEGIQIPQRGDA